MIRELKVDRRTVPLSPLVREVDFEGFFRDKSGWYIEASGG